MKRCSMCGQVKPLSEFHRDSGKKDGHSARCKVCNCANSQRWRAENPQRVRENNRAWRQANLDSIREYCQRGEYKAKANERRNRWYEINSERARGNERARRASIREQVLDHYGRTCTCCGSTDRLTIDHVNGNGGEHRREIGRGSTRLYVWLIRHDFPPGFQVLCIPCNQSKSHRDRCGLHLEVTP